jgi:sugar phosphate isomerase/epimerase
VPHVFVAASTICFSDANLPDACQFLMDLEYDSVELWLSESSPQIGPAEVAADPDAFVQQFHEITRLTPVAFRLAEDVAPETFAGISKAAKLLQVTQITVPSSPLGTPFNEEIDRLKALVEVASRDGIRVSIKTEGGHLTADPDTAVELCGSVRGLGLTLDPSHYLSGPNPVTSFERFAPHVNHVHLRDSTATELQVQVGLGEIDYSKLITQLEKVGYHRALSVELIPRYTDAATRPLEMRKLRMLLDSLL